MKKSNDISPCVEKNENEQTLIPKYTCFQICVIEYTLGLANLY